MPLACLKVAPSFLFSAMYASRALLKTLGWYVAPSVPNAWSEEPLDSTLGPSATAPAEIPEGSANAASSSGPATTDFLRPLLFFFAFRFGAFFVLASPA